MRSPDPPITNPISATEFTAAGEAVTPRRGGKAVEITPPGLRLIPHPAVAQVLSFGGTIALQDTTGRQQQGSVVTGLGFGERLTALRADAFECLQVRLSPVVAHAVLGGGSWPTSTTPR
jgi:hypothetical protein